jgi:WD40 repeat protein
MLLPLPRFKNWAQRIRRFFVGDDVFISYGRNDAINYALALGNALTRSGLSCYLDQWVSRPDTRVPEAVLSSLRRSTVLVVIGSPAAGQSDAVTQELEDFLPTTRSVIPVTFDESIRAAKWYHLIDGLPLAREAAAALASAAPSERLVGRIVNAEGFVSRNRRLRRVFWATSFAIVVLIAGGGVLLKSIDAQRRAADLRREKAEVLTREAEAATRDANKRRGEAEEEALTASKKAEAEAVRAARRQYVSVAQRLAADAPGFQAINRLDERSALLARQAYLLNEANDGDALGEIDQALRRVLSVPGFNINLGRISSPYSAVAFDRDDLIVALGTGINQTTVIVRRARGTQTQTILEQSAGGRVLNLALRHDGRRLAYHVAAQSRAGELRLVDLDARRPQTVIVEPALGSLRALEFSPNGELVIAGGDNGTLRIWNVSGGKPRALLPPVQLTGSVTAVAASADAQIVAAGTTSGALATIDLRSSDPKLVSALDEGCATETRWITSVAFAHDGAILVGERPSGNGTDKPASELRRWKLGRPGSCPEAVEGTAGWPEALAFTPDGARLIASTVNGPLQVWQYPDLTQPPLVFEGAAGASGGLGISSSGSHVASTDINGELRIWALAPSPAEPRVLSGYAGAIAALAIAPNTGLLAGCDERGQIRMWRIDALVREPRTVNDANGDCAAIALTRDGAFLAAAYRHAFEGPPRAVRLWNLRAGGESPPLVPPGGETWAEDLAFSRSGDWLAWATADGIAVWNLRDTSVRPKRFTHGNDRTTAIAWTPDGRIVSGSTAGALRLWNPARNNSRLIERHSDIVRAIAVSPSGEWIVSGSRSGVMILQSALGNTAPRRWSGHDGDISGLSFSADGTSILSSGSDGSVRLWPVPEERQPLIIRTGAPVTTSAITPDSVWIAAGTRDGTIALHPNSTQRLADAVCLLVRRNLSASEWAAHVGTNLPYECTCPQLPPGSGAGTCGALARR